MTTTPARTGTAIRVCAIAALMACSISEVLAADWPVFKPGNWTLERTMSGTGSTPDKAFDTRCIDPTANHKERQATFASAGCQVSPLTQSDNTYRYSATCESDGTTTTSDSVLEVEGADAYTISVESTTDGSKTYDVLHARRVGDCAP